MYFFKFWSKQGEYERENSLGWSKKCHDKKSPLKFAIFELQKWYIPKNKCQLTLQNWGIPAYTSYTTVNPPLFKFCET